MSVDEFYFFLWLLFVMALEIEYRHKQITLSPYIIHSANNQSRNIIVSNQE